MVSPPLFQIHRFIKKSFVLSADFVATNQRCDRLPLTDIAGLARVNCDFYLHCFGIFYVNAQVSKH